MSSSASTKSNSYNHRFKFIEMTQNQKNRMIEIFSSSTKLYRHNKIINSLTREQFYQLKNMIGSSHIYYATGTILSIVYIDDTTLQLQTNEGLFKIDIYSFMQYFYATENNDKFLLYNFNLHFLGKEIINKDLFNFISIKKQRRGGNKIKKITRKVYLDDKGKSYIKYDNKIIYLKLN